MVSNISLAETIYDQSISKGEKVQNRHDTDRELLFRQESNFAYLTGVEVPGSIVQISYEHYAKLFLPLVDKDSVMWSGLPPTVQELASKSDFTEIIEGELKYLLTAQNIDNYTKELCQLKLLQLPSLYQLLFILFLE